MLKEFKAFITKGNVLDLAIGVIMGTAFGKIVSSLVNEIVMPLFGIILGGVNFSSLRYVVVKGSEGVEELAINYGIFIQAIFDFLFISFAIFIFIKLISLAKKKEEAKAEVKKAADILLLEEIRDILQNKNK